MKRISNLTVEYQGRTVGIIAKTKDGLTAFQYDPEWILNGFSISPFSLPLNDKVFIPKADILEGLFGVFADSLPDGWGRLLVDRMLLSMNISPATVHPVERLGIVGSNGMGALEYFPEMLLPAMQEEINYDQLALACENILNEKDTQDFDALFQLGNSSGGARPKVLVSIESEPWIVKFPASYDRKTIGEEEYRYMKCAKNCGINIPEIKLFPSDLSYGYFASKRFDRINGEKLHMITASGLLETSHRTPNLDYHDLMKMTYLLTKDNRALEELFRRMCFNVFAHNRDDHSKNFSYLYHEKEKRWMLAPAYDLTYSSSIGGEHATCVNGNGNNPDLLDLIKVGKTVGLPDKKMKNIAEETESIIQEELSDIIKSYL